MHGSLIEVLKLFEALDQLGAVPYLLSSPRMDTGQGTGSQEKPWFYSNAFISHGHVKYAIICTQTLLHNTTRNEQWLRITNK